MSTTSLNDRRVRKPAQAQYSAHSPGTPAGVHTGEIEASGDKVAGIAVHIGARVTGLAGAGEVPFAGEGAAWTSAIGARHLARRGASAAHAPLDRGIGRRRRPRRALIERVPGDDAPN
jgi:class 3 adenylate cyclase